MDRCALHLHHVNGPCVHTVGSNTVPYIIPWPLTCILSCPRVACFLDALLTLLYESSSADSALKLGWNTLYEGEFRKSSVSHLSSASNMKGAWIVPEDSAMGSGELHSHAMQEKSIKSTCNIIT